MSKFDTFLSAEDGAVTVDWVVLTAGLVGLGLAVSTVVSSGVQDLTTDVDEQLQRDHIIRTSFHYSPEFASVGLSNAQATTSSCIQVPNGSGGFDESCSGQDTMTMWERFNTTDGEQWVRETYTVSGEDPVVTWTDGNGDIVTGEVDVPDDLPSQF